VKWVTPLTQYEDEKKRRPVLWAGPVLAGDRLILAGSNGALINVNPTDGAFQSQVDVKDGISFQPVVANNTLYLLTDSGRLIAYR
jgi:outer membrane protein assembly factor BamB